MCEKVKNDNFRYRKSWKINNYMRSNREQLTFTFG